MATSAAKITRKGQVTIPKEIRQMIKTNAVYFELKGEVVLMKPVPDAAGSLKEFAGRAQTKGSESRSREIAWEEAIHEKTGAKLS
jgi:AbrB family looped-hinge helix DNA binding protein